MPKISTPIPEVYDSISRPVATDLVRDVFEFTLLPRDTPITYLGMGDLPKPQPGSTLDEQHKEKIRFPQSTRFTVEVDEQYYGESPIHQARLRPEHQLVFTDEELDVYMKPIYQIAEVTISVQARFVDKVSALRWRDDVRVMASAGRYDRLHEVKYHFPLPPEFVKMLTKIYELREAQAGHNEDLGTWLRNHLTERYTVATDQAGGNPTITIQEHQIGITGWFDFGADVPEPEREGEGGAYTITFDYNVLYEKCVACAMLYPMMIHNQHIPIEMFTKQFPYEIGIRPAYKSETRSLLDKYGTGYPSSYDAYVGLSIPYYDDWLPEFQPRGFTNLFRVLIQLDSADLTSLFNLKQMGDIEFDPLALAYIEEDPSSMLKETENLFQIYLYRRYRPLDRDYLAIDSDLNLYGTEAFSLRNYYHIWVGLHINPKHLSAQALARLRKHGEMCKKIFRILLPTIEQLGLMPSIAKDGSMPKVEFDRALNAIAQRYYLASVDATTQRKLVSDNLITAHRQE